MLGTLSDSQKDNWRGHAYNVTIHPSTGFSPYYLMFGRHPKLAIGAFLGLPDNIEKPTDQSEYVRKLEDRLSLAYSRDVKAKASALQPGDLVLARNLNIRGRLTLANMWEDKPYVVVSKPNSDIPVYEVKRTGTGNRKSRVVHRFFLLPLGMLKKPRGGAGS